MNYTCGNCNKKFTSDIEVENMLCQECLLKLVVGPMWDEDFE